MYVCVRVDKGRQAVKITGKVTLVSFFLSLFISIKLLILKTILEDGRPCKAICMNGGTCVNGQCSCAEGYNGEFCTERKSLNIIF